MVARKGKNAAGNPSPAPRAGAPKWMVDMLLAPPILKFNKQGSASFTYKLVEGRWNLVQLPD